MMLICVTSFGQAQINTKKVKIGDFTEKVTKVVISNGFLDGVIQDEITSRWRVSPYEFCTIEDFEKHKGNDDFYFLLTTSGKFKKDSEPTLQFLTLVKGGSGAENGIDGMLEIVSLPIASAKFPSGRELLYLPAFIDIIQDYTLQSTEKDANAYGGLGSFTSRIPRIDECPIIISEDDLAEEMDIITEQGLAAKNIIVAGEDATDEYFNDNETESVVSYVVAPYEPESGTYCYKMLIGSQSHKLYYFKRHRISRNLGAGFTTEDIRRISAGRKK